MDSKELTVVALKGESPKDHMSRLGQLSRELMDARIRANQAGLEAIRSAVSKLSTQVDEEQARLLAAYPELIMMAFEKAVA